MRYKYVMKKNAGQDRLSLDEYARVEAESFTLINHKTFDLRRVKAAVLGSRKDLISVLRTDNLYPPSGVMEKIVDAITGLMGSGNLDASEVIADDLEFLKEKGKRIAAPEPLEAEISEIDITEDIDAEPEVIPHSVELDENRDSFNTLFPLDEVA